MRHFEEQNASFRSVKWLILKIKPKNFAILFNPFTVSKRFVSLKRSKIPAKKSG